MWGSGREEWDGDAGEAGKKADTEEAEEIKGDREDTGKRSALKPTVERKTENEGRAGVCVGEADVTARIWFVFFFGIHIGRL